MADCDQKCSGCSVENCGSRIEKYTLLSGVKVKKVIGIASGKGGVGKTMVTALLALELSKKGYKVGILDADITGPSIPKMFGNTEKVKGTERGIVPNITKENIKIVSTNLFLEKEDDPVLWRGPVLTNLIRQFFSQTEWGELDFLLIDMPPGTGDVPLTIYQSIDLDGVIIVTTPQDLVSMVVGKAVNMCKMMNIKTYGFVINMAYIKCPCCHEDVKLFYGNADFSKKYNLPVLATLPMDPKINELIFNNKFEELEEKFFDKVILKLNE